MIPDYEFWEDQIFVYTPTKNYTASDFVELFNDIGAPVCYPRALPLIHFSLIFNILDHRNNLQ